MTSAQVVERSVTNKSSSQNYTHPDSHTMRTKEIYVLYLVLGNQLYIDQMQGGLC